MMKTFLTLILVMLMTPAAWADVIILGAKKPTPKDVAIIDYDRIARAAADMDDGVLTHSYAMDEIERTNPVDAPTDDGSIISLSLDAPNDPSLDGMQQVGIATRPDPLVIPFLEEFPIENIEVKFRLLKEKF